MTCGYFLPTFLSFISVVIGGGGNIKYIFSVHTTRRVAMLLSDALFATWRRRSEKKGADRAELTSGSASTVQDPTTAVLGLPIRPEPTGWDQIVPRSPL